MIVTINYVCILLWAPLKMYSYQMFAQILILSHQNQCDKRFAKSAPIENFCFSWFHSSSFPLLIWLWITYWTWYHILYIQNIKRNYYFCKILQYRIHVKFQSFLFYNDGIHITLLAFVVADCLTIKHFTKYSKRWLDYFRRLLPLVVPFVDLICLNEGFCLRGVITRG